MICFFLLWIDACKDPRPQWEAIYSQGRSAFERGDFDVALARAQEGFKTSKSDPGWNYKFRVLEAEADLWQGKKEEVVRLLHPAPPAAVASTELAIRRNIILGSALALSRPSEAPSLLDEAEHLANKISPHLLGDVALARGRIAWYKPDLEVAQQEYRRALTLSRQYKDSFLEAEALGNLGPLLTRMERYGEARDWNSSALTVTQSHGYRYLQAGALVNLGWNYLELGDFDNALDAFKNMESLSSDAHLKHIANSNIGRIYLNQGDDKRASEYFARALEIAISLGDESGAGVCLDNLALAALGMGDVKAADAYNQRALKIHRAHHKHEEEMRSLLTAANIADARNDFVTAEPLLHQVIRDTDTLPSVRIEAEDERARLYAASGQTSRAREQFKRVLSKIERVRLDIEGEENRLAFSFWEAGFHTAYISFLADHRDPQGALRVTELMRARTLEEGLGGEFKHPRQLRISSIQKFLAARNEVILAYWLAPERSFLWVVTPSSLRIFTLPAKQQIDARVKLYQETINAAKDTENGDENGEKLYRMLVEPAKALIPVGARVVVIPDGGLGQLNFETLLVPGKRPHFWIRDVELQDASSLALLMKQRSNHAGGNKLLVMGDPVEADPEYPRLRYASSEMNAMRFVTGKTIISGAHAVPSAYKTARPGEYDVIHFATHGFASEKSPLDSAIILSPQADGAFKLYAREIIKVPLKARVVVISACYGAGKRTYSAEGLVGLAWAFLRAGAHQVIAGLWNVNDESTSILMKDFYAEWQKSKNTAAALRAAKLKMLKSPEKAFHRPYYWASLQLYTGS